MKKLVILFASLLALIGCKNTEYITVERLRIDTTYITKYQRDSINVHDSVFVSVAGDTVRIEKWHTKYVLQEKYDTVYQAKIDSVPVPYPLEVEVQRELTWWQKARMDIGSAVMLALLLFGIYYIVKRKFFS